MKFIWIIVSIFLFLFLFLSPLKATITEEEKDAAIELNDQFLREEEQERREEEQERREEEQERIEEKQERSEEEFQLSPPPLDGSTDQPKHPLTILDSSIDQSGDYSTFRDSSIDQPEDIPILAPEIVSPNLLCGRHRFYLLCSFPLKNHDLHSQLQCLFFYYLDF